MQENSGVVTPTSELKPSSQSPDEQGTSENLLRGVTLNLYGVMRQVTQQNVTSETVNAACNCAKQIHKLLELNYKISKGNK
jgi:hypothetical protein